MFKRKMEKNNEKVNNVNQSIVPTEINEVDRNLICPAFLPDMGFSSSSILNNTFYNREHNQETFFSIFNGMMNFENDCFVNSNPNVFTNEVMDAPVTLEVRREMLHNVFNQRVNFVFTSALNNFIEMCYKLSMNIVLKLNDGTTDRDNDTAYCSAFIGTLSDHINKEYNYLYRYRFNLRNILDGMFVGKLGNIAEHAFMDFATDIVSKIYTSWYKDYFLKLREIGIGDEYLGIYTPAVSALRDTFNYLYNYLYNEACSIYRDASFPNINPAPKKSNRYLEEDWD